MSVYRYIGLVICLELYELSITSKKYIRHIIYVYDRIMILIIILILIRKKMHNCFQNFKTLCTQIFTCAHRYI